MNNEQINSNKNANQNQISHTAMEPTSVEVTLNMDGVKVQEEDRPRADAEKEITDSTELVKDVELVIDMVKIGNITEKGKNSEGFVTNIYGRDVRQVYWAQQGNYPPPNQYPQYQQPPPQNYQQAPQQGWFQGPPPPPHQNFQHYPPDHQYVPYDPETRNSFVKLVFTILMFMLLATAVMVFYCLTLEPLRSFFISLPFMTVLIATVMVMALSYAMACCPCARKLPCNIIMLIIAVLLFTVITAKTCVRYKTNILILSFVITAAVVLLCIALACTKFDFTSYMLYILGISMALSLVGIALMVMMLVLKIKMTGVLIGFLAISVLVQVVMLIMELQMVLGGKSVELEEDDYAYGAYLLYTSIINLFLTIVQLLGLIDS